MSGLDEEQLSELEYRVAGLLEEPWDKGEGRPHELTLREAIIVTCGYMRQNIIEDVWADIFGVAQSSISRYITFLTPFAEKATEEDRPTEEDAADGAPESAGATQSALGAPDHGPRIVIEDYAKPLVIASRAAISELFRKPMTRRVKC